MRLGQICCVRCVCSIHALPHSRNDRATPTRHLGGVSQNAARPPNHCRPASQQAQQGQMCRKTQGHLQKGGPQCTLPLPAFFMLFRVSFSLVDKISRSINCGGNEPVQDRLSTTKGEGAQVRAALKRQPTPNRGSDCFPSNKVVPQQPRPKQAGSKTDVSWQTCPCQAEAKGQPCRRAHAPCRPLVALRPFPPVSRCMVVQDSLLQTNSSVCMHGETRAHECAESLMRDRLCCAEDGPLLCCGAFPG